MLSKLRELLAPKREHECWPPEGVVFEPTWTCPECWSVWDLIEHANHSEWVRRGTQVTE